MNDEMRRPEREGSGKGEGSRDGTWVVSSFSNPGNCVELRFTDVGVQVRDSKNPGGAVLEFNRAEWEAFLLGTFHGEFGRG